MTGESRSAFILGAFICIGLTVAGFVLGSSAIRVKEYERVVAVKGLAERKSPRILPSGRSASRQPAMT